MHITDDQLDRYRRQGFLIIENFLTEQERSAALDGFFSRFAPPYQEYVAAGRNNLTPRRRGGDQSPARAVPGHQGAVPAGPGPLRYRRTFPQERASWCGLPRGSEGHPPRNQPVKTMSTPSGPKNRELFNFLEHACRPGHRSGASTGRSATNSATRPSRAATTSVCNASTVRSPAGDASAVKRATSRKVAAIAVRTELVTVYRYRLRS